MDFIDTLIRDYDMLAVEAREKADDCRRSRELYEHEGQLFVWLLSLIEWECKYRADAISFQVEADRLRGSNARRVRASTVSTGVSRGDTGYVPGRSSITRQGPRVPVSGSIAA